MPRKKDLTFPTWSAYATRPLRKSLSEAIQIGGGLRSSPNTGKKDCLLLDFSGNIIRMADDYSDVFYNGLDALDNGEKLDKTIRRDKEEEPEGESVPDLRIQADGQALRIVRTRGGQGISGRARARRDARGSHRKTKYADDKRHLWEQAASYARGYSVSGETTGTCVPYLPGDYRRVAGSVMDGCQHAERADYCAVLNKIRSRNIAYAKARMAHEI